MSQFNTNRRWIFERDLYGEDCIVLQPSYAEHSATTKGAERKNTVGPIPTLAVEVARVDRQGGKYNAKGN